jgi:high-affinity nickel-transport protein
MSLALDAPATGFGIALIVSSFAFGFRHGIDWDHIAAITDITSSQRDVRTGLRFATLYAAGHAAVVFVIGVVAIVLGKELPDSVDAAMGRVVGVTLLVLGVYVLYALIRYREDFRLRSRWMLLFAGVRRGYRWIRDRGERAAAIEHEHSHVSDDHFTHHDDLNGDARGGGSGVQTRTHTHPHTHTDPFMNYGTGTSLAVGMLHGVGAETPTQVLIFLTAAGAGGARAGLIVLGVFLLGLFTANTALALASASGFLAASRRFGIYAAVSVVTAVASLILGVAFLLGQDSWLPVFFGG